MPDDDRSRDLTAAQLLDSLEALGRAVVNLNAHGKQIRIAVVPDGLWLEGFDHHRGAFSRLIPTRAIARTPAYALAKEVEAFVLGQ
ncbi:MAG: hypothetical protein PGN34_16245 [Methylobacterium frigidaeris]